LFRKHLVNRFSKKNKKNKKKNYVFNYLTLLTRFFLRNRTNETPATSIPPAIDVIAIMIMVKGNPSAGFPISLIKVSGSIAI